MTAKEDDFAESARLHALLDELGEGLEEYLRFEDRDAMENVALWRSALAQPLPDHGIGIEPLVAEIRAYLLPNGSPIPKPGFSAFITTGASTAAVIAALAGMVAAPQRLGLTAFSYLEELSLQWLAELFKLPDGMQGVYSSGGSVANIVALGAARQAAFETFGHDVARDGVHQPCRIFASAAAHRTIHRAAAVLGLGRESVIPIALDRAGRMRPDDLARALAESRNKGGVDVAIVANAGATDTGAIDPLDELGQIANEHGIWFHVDGAYGLPGMLDPALTPLYAGLRHADSTCVDPHKWLGAPVGVGATFVRDRAILRRAFTQGAAGYLDGSVSGEPATRSMDSLGVPYYDFGVELSAPCRGAIVWAIIREIGRDGLAHRITRHNAMARHVAQRARTDARLELVLEPTLSICCFRYYDVRSKDLDGLNREIHRQLVRSGTNLPSTTTINGKLVIRPCFIGARTGWQQADDLVDEVLAIGERIISRNIDRKDGYSP